MWAYVGALPQRVTRIHRPESHPPDVTMALSCARGVRNEARAVMYITYSGEFSLPCAGHTVAACALRCRPKEATCWPQCSGIVSARTKAMREWQTAGANVIESTSTTLSTKRASANTLPQKFLYTSVAAHTLGLFTSQNGTLMKCAHWISLGF